MKFLRPCRKCDNPFRPNGSQNYICMKCRDKMKPKMTKVFVFKKTGKLVETVDVDKILANWRPKKK